MMQTWQSQLKIDPLPALLSLEDEALHYFVRRDLLEEQVTPIDYLWQLPGALKILHKQLPDGAWKYPGQPRNQATNYGLIETWKQFRFLVQIYGMTRDHPQVHQAAEYIFSCQTDEGDIRGILANQYATYYTGAILYLLIEAGYADDMRIAKGLRWLLSMRQDDGGWSVPMITHKLDRKRWLALSSQYFEPLQPDRSKPFSHSATGMVLRAFAAHPEYLRLDEVRIAAGLLASRFFLPDAYTSYKAASYWVKFQYPFWWNNLVAALDTVSRIGIPADEAHVSKAREWLVANQGESGLWKTSYVEEAGLVKENADMRGMSPWVSLAICRVLKRYGGMG